MTIPAWARDFDNQPRHCWTTSSGARQLHNGLGYCIADHNPKLTDATEWLRFIRLFGKTGDSPFAPSDQPGPNDPRYHLLNETDGHPTSDGRRTYCETYLVEHEGDWGLEPVFRVFLANAEGWARIECYDEELVGRCEQALADVEASYRKEDTDVRT